MVQDGQTHNTGHRTHETGSSWLVTYAYSPGQEDTTPHTGPHGGCTWGLHLGAQWASRAMGGSLPQEEGVWFPWEDVSSLLEYLSGVAGGWSPLGRRLGSVQMVWPLGELAGWGALPPPWEANLMKTEELMAWTLGPCETQRHQGDTWNFRSYNTVIGLLPSEGPSERVAWSRSRWQDRRENFQAEGSGSKGLDMELA